MLKHKLRGCADWRAEGLELTSTVSDSASKLYDSALNQLCGLYDDQDFGGFANTLADMRVADPEFVLGQALAVGLELGSTTADNASPESRKAYDELIRLMDSNRETYGRREVLHVDAVRQLAVGDARGAARVWEEILCLYPTDMHALRMAHGMYFDRGLQEQLRDSIARVVPHWRGRSLPLEGYVHGMYAFGLEETHFYVRAEREASLALAMNECDGWAAHAMAHIHETYGQTERGVQFLTARESDWRKCNFIACHNYWHLALHYMSAGEYERALQVFDEQIVTSLARTNGRMGNLVDATQLLYRLGLKEDQLMNGELGRRWEQVYDLVNPITSGNSLGFFDIHYLLASVGADRWDTANELRVKVADNKAADDQWLKTTGVIMDAIIAYSREKYEKCVNLLLDVRYDMSCLGGSNAQRDLFNQILVSAALKSPLECHNQLSTHLVNEMDVYRDDIGLVYPK